MRLRWTDVIRALDHRGDGQYGVDRETGNVQFFDVHELESDDPREILDEAACVMVDPVADWVVGEWVAELAEQLGRAGLTDAADDPHPRRAVRRRLADEPDELEAWRCLYRRRLEEAAEAWVESHGLRPENSPPWRDGE